MWYRVSVRSRDCLIIDMSPSGAAVSADVQPDVGMPRAIGSCIGRVVRHFREGFAVKFVAKQNEATLEKSVARSIRQLPRFRNPPSGNAR